MYGLILENIHQHTCRKYGRDVWDDIRRLANIKEPSFSIHRIYPDNYVPRITAKAVEFLNITEREYLYGVGVSFVSFVGVYGYDKILSVLGRQFRDFLNGLDNLHEYLRFSYPKLKPPSYFCNNETEDGMTLHYRSKRQYFLWYTIGQIEEVGRHFYQTVVKTEVLAENNDNEEYYFVLQLRFDNKAFAVHSQQLSISRTQIQIHSESSHLQFMPLMAKSLFQIFPFCLVFDSDLAIKAVGGCLQVVLPDIIGRDLPKVFSLLKPKVGYNWLSITGHLNNTFELASIQPLKRDISRQSLDQKFDTNSCEDNFNFETNNDCIDGNDCHEYLLRLKGQMLYMEEWKCMIYLAAPNIADVEAMTRTGLYLNDLSLHDFSREMVLAGQQQTAELKLALDQELHKSKQLEESMIKLDQEMKRTDELLYQMIADRLRRGENPIDTCQYFPCVTILFSDIVNFTVICSRITPMQVVNMLNSMYSMFDELTERHFVYKVETIGDAYMICSGGGILDGQDNVNHAQKVCEIALDMIRVVFKVRDPSSGNNLNIRIVVGGIVGQKMPRYCLFGDTVNTASRIESSSEAQMVQISEMTKAMLDPNLWDIYERGTIPLKGKGFMKTYWLYGHHPIGGTSGSGQVLTEIDEFGMNRVDRHKSGAKTKISNTSIVSMHTFLAENQLNSLKHNSLAKGMPLYGQLNADNNKCIVKIGDNISPVVCVEGQQKHANQRPTTICTLDRVNTNNRLINNKFFAIDSNISSMSVESTDTNPGCFACKSKSNDDNNTSNESHSTCNIS